MIFSVGDMVRYHGGALVNGRGVMMAGDEAIVIRANEDYDDDVTVSFGDCTFMVSHEMLEWLAGA